MYIRNKYIVEYTRKGHLGTIPSPGGAACYFHGLQLWF